MIRSTAFEVVLLCLFIHHTEATPHVDDVLGEILANYCPKVDICDRNATSADLQPNEKLDIFGSVSCCKGCSCHPDCKSKLNCCYPDEDDADPVCTHMRIGAPGIPKWDATVPAYYTIWTPPVGGCINDQPFQTVTGETLQPTCGRQPAAYWGTLYPVLSSVSKDIYKNEACARCHGITDYEPFLPFLECEMPITGMKDRVTLTDYIRMYANSQLPPFCYFEFKHRDVSGLKAKSCLVDPLATCDPGAIDQSAIVTGLSFDEIEMACKNGAYSPVVKDEIGYRNIFCLLCNAPSNRPTDMKCDQNERRAGSDRPTMAFLLNRKYLKSSSSPLTTRPDSANNPTACMKDGESWQEATCRTMHCPTGMIHNDKGTCVHISNTWIGTGFYINVKLSPISGNISPFEENILPLIEGIKQSNPWPAQWRLRAALIKLQDGLAKTDGMFIIGLECNKKSISMAKLQDEVRQALSKTWKTEVNGTRLEFIQSILEYSLMRKENTIFRPSWTFSDKTNTTGIDKDDAAMWKMALSEGRTQRVLNYFYKRYLCEQVDLRTDEFDSEVDQYLIKNKLDGRWLFDQEFVMVDHEMGNRVARVCLSDTPLVERTSGVESTSGHSAQSVFLQFALVAMMAYCL